MQSLKHAYPRPIDVCDECNKTIILCRGEIINPYWRHERGSSCSNNLGESYNHKLAKKLFTNYLNSGGKINVKIDCPHNKDHKMSVPQNITLYKQEVKYGKCIFDIAGLNKNGEIVFGIEIWHKHKTTNIFPRSTVPWIEVKSMDILAYLNTNEKIENVSSLSLTSFRKYSCPSIKDLSRSLGYFKNDFYSCKALEDLDKARKGNYMLNEMWNVKGSFSNQNLWDKFLSLHKCMRCEKDHNTKKFYPFCFQCYRKIKQDEEIDKTILVPISKEERKILRQKFKWLNSVPEIIIFGDLCYFCERDYISDDEYVYWHKKERRCCTICLQERYEKL